MVATAQGICVINGTIADCKLNDGKKVKSVTLTRTDESGREIEVATAKVKKGKYTFKCEISKDEPVLMYEIRGFDEGAGIELFVEEGTVEVTTASAAQVCESRVGGTPTNDVYSGFKAILNNGYLEAEKYSDESLKSKEKVKTMSQAIRYLIDHNASPMTPLMIERWLLHMLTPTYADQMLKTIALPLHSHPYYLSLRNKVLAGNLKVGSEVPEKRIRQQGIPRQNCHCLSVDFMVGGPSPAQVIIVHAGQIVMDQAVSMDHLHCRSKGSSRLPVAAAHSAKLKGQHRTQPLATVKQAIFHRVKQKFLGLAVKAGVKILQIRLYIVPVFRQAGVQQIIHPQTPPSQVRHRHLS